MNDFLLKFTIVHVGHLLVTTNVLVDKANTFFVKIALAGELINVVPEGVILLLSLNECGDDLVNVGNT